MEGKSTIYNLFYNNLLQSSVIVLKNSNFPKKKISKSPDFQNHPRVPPLVFSKSQIGEHFGGQQSKWRIWRTKWPNGEHSPERTTLDTYGWYILFLFNSRQTICLAKLHWKSLKKKFRWAGTLHLVIVLTFCVIKLLYYLFFL